MALQSRTGNVWRLSMSPISSKVRATSKSKSLTMQRFLKRRLFHLLPMETRSSRYKAIFVFLCLSFRLPLTRIFVFSKNLISNLVIKVEHRVFKIYYIRVHAYRKKSLQIKSAQFGSSTICTIFEIYLL